MALGELAPSLLGELALHAEEQVSLLAMRAEKLALILA